MHGATMNAAFVDGLTGAEGIRYGRLPVPENGDRDVLVKVTGVTANHVDTFVRSGKFATELSFPLVMGRDVVGTVAACGREVTEFRLGDAVWSNSMGHGGRQGTAADFVSVPADRLYPLPTGVDPLDAVAVLHPGATAYLALHTHAKLRAGECVFVGGGAGQVGSALIVQAVRAGARALASAAPKDAQYCRDLGAEIALDYRSTNLGAELAAAAGAGIDVYIETSGHHDLALAVDNLALRGRIVLLSAGNEPTVPIGKLYTRDGSILGFVISNASVSELAGAATAINSLLAENTLVPRHIDVLPLSRMGQAHSRLEAGEVHGTRLVLIPTTAPDPDNRPAARNP